MKFTDRIRKFMRGEIRFEAKNGFPERFISVCSNSGTVLKNVVLSKNGLTASTDRRSADRINRAAAESGMEITVLSEFGASVILGKLRYRFGIPAGIIAAFVLFCMLSGTVWSVEISGCETIPPENIAEILTACGIKRGAFIYNVDCGYAEDILESFSSSVYKALVNISGCRVYADIVENTIPQQVKDLKLYSNITAKRGGEIIKADVFAGESALRPGDGVVRGDLLVSGVSQFSDGRYIFSDSEARIIARTVHNINCSAAEKAEVSILNKTRDIYSPYLFGVCVLPGKNLAKGELSETEYLADTKRSVFPIGIKRQRETRFVRIEKEWNEKQRFLLCFSDLSVSAAAQLKDCVNVGRKINVIDNVQSVIEAEFICEENICEKQYFEVYDQN